MTNEKAERLILSGIVTMAYLLLVRRYTNFHLFDLHMLNKAKDIIFHFIILIGALIIAFVVYKDLLKIFPLISQSGRKSKSIEVMIVSSCKYSTGLYCVGFFLLGLFVFAHSRIIEKQGTRCSSGKDTDINVILVITPPAKPEA